MTPRVASFRKAHPSAGARPGTLVIPSGSPPPALFLMRYSPEGLEERPLSGAGEIPTGFPDGTVTWIDVRGYDAIEDDLAAENVTLERLGRVRRSLVMLRRIAAPQREMVQSLVKDASPFVSPEVREFLRDTHDHIAQITELGDASRELAGALSNELLSMVGHRTNEVMKMLTLMASIFIPLTFIAGIYGMNFEYMPELDERYGYFIALTVMIVVAFGMIVYFRYRGWTGARRARRRARRS
ncbi:MAG: CorA family divalent cation transporter [Acidobacteriota bacterium]